MALSELIKYEGDNSTFIWKYPHEDFNNMTELVVHETQEAIFVANGQIADIFGPGRYKLDAQNIPTDIYGIQGIPHIILFGPDGTIVKRDLRGSAIEAEVAKYVKPVK